MDDESIRAAWKTGSICDIFSKSAKQWLPGEIIDVFSDEQGEWLKVRYAQTTTKQVQRHSDDIRAPVECLPCTATHGTRSHDAHATHTQTDGVRQRDHASPPSDEKQTENDNAADPPQSTDADDVDATDDASIRAGWLKGSRCAVFSKSAQQWVVGRVADVSTDAEGEWLEVHYGDKSTKQVQRHSADIRPPRVE